MVKKKRTAEKEVKKLKESVFGYVDEEVNAVRKACD